MSEVARIKAEIETAYQAAHLALHGPAIVSRHEIITKRMEQVQRLHQELVPLVGQQEAIQTVIDIAEKHGG